MLEDTMKKIEQKCKLNAAQLDVIRAEMANYGIACVMDSKVRAEAEQVCQILWVRDQITGW